MIPDGIDVAGFLGLTPAVEGLFRDERLSDVDIVGLTPTRIVRRKNLEAGIEIVAALKNKGKSIRWMITGAPDPHNTDVMAYFKKLVSLRRKLGVRKEVIFLCERLDQRVDDDDLRALFAVSDTLIFPSSQEGFGIPALEGGLGGLLLVLSDIPALREIAGSQAVYIGKTDSPASVARRVIAGLKSSPRLSFRKKIISGYSWDAVFANRILPAAEKRGTLWPKK